MQIYCYSLFNCQFFYCSLSLKLTLYFALSLFLSYLLRYLSLFLSLFQFLSLALVKSHAYSLFSSLFFSLASALFLLPLESPVLSSTSLVLVRYIFLSFVSLNLSPLSDFSPLSCNRTVSQSLTFAPPPSTILYLLLSPLHALSLPLSLGFS